MWYADLRQQTELLIKKDNLHISRKVTVKKRYIQKKKTAEKTNIIYLLFRVWHFVAIMISPNTLGSENGLCQSMVYVSQWSMSVNGLCRKWSMSMVYVCQLDRFLSGFGQNWRILEFLLTSVRRARKSAHKFYSIS